MRRSANGFAKTADRTAPTWLASICPRSPNGRGRPLKRAPVSVRTRPGAPRYLPPTRPLTSTFGHGLVGHLGFVVASGDEAAGRSSTRTGRTEVPRTARRSARPPGEARRPGELHGGHPVWHSRLVRIIRAQLEGAEAEPGRIAAADVARIIVGLERAIASAAYLVLRRTRRGAGRHKQTIEKAARLRFVGVEPGSFVEVLALPDVGEVADGELPIRVADLSSQALDRLLDIVEEPDEPADPDLASAVAQMAADLGIGERNASITLSDDGPSGGSPRARRVVIDASVRARMQRLSSPPLPVKDQTLVGILVEADFERNTARLRLPSGSSVDVTFSPDLSDDIQEALRSSARLDGVLQYNARTSEVKSVRLRALYRTWGTQLVLGSESFWHSPTFAQLQEVQGTTGHVVASGLAITDLTDDERAAFLAAFEQ